MGNLVFKLFVFLLTILWVNANIFDPYYCYSSDKFKPQRATLGLFTPYDAVKGENLHSKVSNCTASKFWMIFRYGSTLPTPSEVERIFANKDEIKREIEDNHDDGKTTLCAGDLSMIRTWKLNEYILPNSSQELTPSGMVELKAVAARFLKEFPDLLASKFSKQHHFRPLGESRSKNSLIQFGNGLYEGQNIKIEPQPGIDLLLRPHQSCSIYKDLVKKSPERTKFFNTTEFIKMRDAVSKKLGYDLISFDKLEAIVDISRYEQIISPHEDSAFLSAFSIGDLATYEYYDELESYFRFGYGFKEHRNLTENLSCGLIQDLMDHMKSASDGELARVFSSDEASLLTLFVLLGLFNDKVPLTSENFAKQANRAWRTSQISPMAANLAVIRYDCPNVDKSLLFLLNEKPVHLTAIPSCKENGFCELTEFVKFFERYLDAKCPDVYCKNTRIVKA